jgi:hypothetical protein
MNSPNVAAPQFAPASPPRLSNVDLGRRFDALVAAAQLTPETNGFFKRSKFAGAVAPAQALAIARDWREIAKAFMLNTIRGIGVIAESAAREPNPSHAVLGTLQTMFRVIGDDLNNALPVFRDVAPKGVAGIHYVWWEDAIVKPVLAHCSEEEARSALAASPGVSRLIDGMGALCQSPLGAVVHLRVVEAIALEIAIAFKRVFARAEAGGRRLFPRPADLDWMNTHIRAEVTHHAEVSGDETAVTALAQTLAAQEEMLALAARYAQMWGEALADFERSLA